MLAQERLVHDSASTLWRSLIEKAGLDVIEGNPDGKDHYDEDLVDGLRERWFPGRTEHLGTLLDRASPSISVEELIRAFLSEIAPFGMMKYDILEFLAAAGARRGEMNLRIRFDFDPENEPLDLLLDEFREQMQVLSPALRLVVRRVWSDANMWEIFRIADDYLPKYGVQDQGGPDSDPLLRSWLRDYIETGRFEELADDAWTTGVEEIDERLAAVSDLLKMLLEANLRYAPNRESLSEVRSIKSDTIDEKSGFTVGELWQIESDYWAGAVVDWLDRLKRALAEAKRGQTVVSLKELQAVVIDGLDRVVPPVDASVEPKEVLVQRLEDILNLPLWKRRNEVYAVWIAAQIWRALQPDWSFRFHLEDGALSFAFSGVHLATLFQSKTNQVLAFWTELRTMHSDLPSGKRTTGIQPDYRLLAAPFKGTGRDALVVEVKQYKQSNTSNFSAAIEDYSFACPSAGVLLVNYGRVSSRVMEALSAPAAERSMALEHVRPDFDRERDGFRETVRRITQGALDGDVVAALRPRRLVQSITLEWDERPRDLDLHLFRMDDVEDHVWYDSREYGTQVRLIDDIKSGRGPEVIEMTGPTGIWLVAVHLYSDDANGVAGSGAAVSVHFHSTSDSETVSFECPEKAEGRWWTVCVLDTEVGSVKPIDQIGDQITVR